MIAVIDTDALLAIINSRDALHLRAIRLAKLLAEKKVQVAILPTTLGEFALLATSKVGMKPAQKTTNFLISGSYLLVEIGRELTAQAIGLYQKQSSKKNSLFDCFVMVAAQKLSADCVFSFDRGYTKSGFLLAEQWLKEGR